MLNSDNFLIFIKFIGLGGRFIFLVGPSLDRIKMILAHIFLPAMLLVICKTQQAPAHITTAIGNEESVYNDSPASETPNATSKTELLDRYRQLVAKSLIKMHDSCKVHDFLQNFKHDMENDMSKYFTIPLCCLV